jgi:protein-disulfide isomerase
MKEKLALILSTVQTIILIAILVILLTDKKPTENRPGVITGQLEEQTKVTKPLKIRDTDAIWGKKDAPNTIIAFVDYQCPFCAEVYKSIKELDKEYISTGKVKVIFRDFPLKMHANANKFAVAVECARKQGKFWEMAGLILEAKDKSDESSIDKWADELKLNKESFAACMADSTINESIQKDMDEAKSYMVRGTPALFINDVFYRGTQSASTLKDIIDGKKIGKKPKTGSCNQKHEE